MTNKSTPTPSVLRDEKGRIAAGSAPINPRGKPPLPDWLKDKGPVALKYIADVACGEVPVEKVKYRLHAAEVIVQRVWGKPDANINVETSTSTALEVLMALAKPKEQDPTS